MSEIKALDKLRVSEDAAEYQWIRSDYLNQIADELEAEVAEARETTRKKHQAERVYWQNELHKILDTINGQERFWGDCMDYPLPEATIPPSEIARCMLAERYIKLPTDKNGNVIHIGDMVKHADGDVYEVLGVDNDGTRQGVFINTGDGRYPIDSWCASGMELYKPRTLEDVLRDVWKEALDYAKSDMWRNPDEVFAERADEIRELLGGDAE